MAPGRGGGPYMGLRIMGGGGEKNLGLGPTIIGLPGGGSIIGLLGGPIPRGGPAMTIGGGIGPPRADIVGCCCLGGSGRGVLEGPMSE